MRASRRRVRCRGPRMRRAAAAVAAAAMRAIDAGATGPAATSGARGFAIKARQPLFSFSPPHTMAAITTNDRASREPRATRERARHTPTAGRPPLPPRQASDLRAGTVISDDGRLAVVTKCAYTQGAGRQAGIVLATLKELATGRAVQRRWRPGDSIDDARLEESTVDILYRDGDASLAVMDAETFVQSTVPLSLLPPTAAALLPDGARLTVSRAPGSDAIVAAAPADTAVAVAVVEVPPPRAGAQAQAKRATVEGGAVVAVPEYVKVGDRVVVDLSDGSFVRREK